MIDGKKAFSGFAVKDTAATKQFYGQTLGLDIAEDEMGLQLNVGGGNAIFIYPKPDHEPATYTILNFPVDDIDKVVDELIGKGVEFEHYDEGDLKTDKKGIARGREAGMGPDIAWFRDPSGNILSVLQN
jgi:catechol 2,3-dioxygenase-like lactoylglutathione lyase family enzyme